jgi:hypothetical protein
LDGLLSFDFHLLPERLALRLDLLNTTRDMAACSLAVHWERRSTPTPIWRKPSAATPGSLTVLGDKRVWPAGCLSINDQVLGFPYARESEPM